MILIMKQVSLSQPHPNILLHIISHTDFAQHFLIKFVFSMTLNESCRNFSVFIIPLAAISIIISLFLIVIVRDVVANQRSLLTSRSRQTDPTLFYFDPLKSNVEWNQSDTVTAGTTTVATIRVSQYTITIHPCTYLR